LDCEESDSDSGLNSASMEGESELPVLDCGGEDAELKFPESDSAADTSG